MEGVTMFYEFPEATPRPCPKCGRASKAIAGNPDWTPSEPRGWVRFRCSYCSHVYERRPYLVAAARKSAAVAQRRRRRVENQIAAWRDRVCTKPRTESHRVLTVTPEIRKAWADVRKAKRYDSFARRAQIFVNLVLTRSRDRDEHGRTKGIPVVRGGTIEWDAHKIGHWEGFPRVEIDDTLWSLGLFEQATLKGKRRIAINAKQLGYDLTEMRTTLVHEVLHALDAEAGIECGNHDSRWAKRLAVMYRMFPPEPYGTSRRAPRSLNGSRTPTVPEARRSRVAAR